MYNGIYERKLGETFDEYKRRMEQEARMRHYEMMRDLQGSHYSGVNLQPSTYYENHILKTEQEQKERNKKLILLL